ncbi:MAG: hypothetical protein JM58_11290 [Peptococcaceae bacterium BICA1-8]|nr:MAG: hypothetical protein JM58_11290 [Peptococcaceae bacterium BICA1-8]
MNALASDFIALLVKEDFESASEYFDADMLKALPQDKLGEIWGQLKDQVGAYQDELSRKQEVTDGYDVIIVTTQFEKSPLNIRMVFNSDKRISGLFFQPAESASAARYEVPAYADMDKVIEEEIVIGEGEWALPGTLTFPSGDGPWPMVVLVHGSGPNDRDETMGPNKPFKDLALGLASRGIGVLRYDKRTLVHGQKIISEAEGLTVQEETIEDALLGVAFLKGSEKVDSNHIFVLGHSLGGMLVPRIGIQTKDIAGLIIMAGAARPLEDLIVEQMTYIAELDGTISDSEKANLAEAERLALKVKDLSLDPDTPASELMGVPAEYWLDLQGYQPAEIAKTLEIKMLILQGERDYQVTMQDFGIWKAALDGKNGVIFKSFPSLNHLMMAGTGPGLSKPEEYQTPGHVAEEVIEAIVGFVL